MRKYETQTPKTVPNKTFKSDRCRNCKDVSHAMSDCLKLAKPRKLEKDPNTGNCRNCNTDKMMKLQENHPSRKTTW